MSTERRFCKAHGEVRAAVQDGQRVLSGYALRYGKLSSTLKSRDGAFRERIMPGACRSLAKSGFRGCLALWNHDANFPLASVASQTLKLTDDSRGLRYDITLGDTSYARDLHTNVMNGVVRGSSFGFVLDGSQDDKWEERELDEDEENDAEDDMDLFGSQQDDVQSDYDDIFSRKTEKRGKKVVIRTINNFRQITDVSPVAFAAYPSSSVSAAVRSMMTTVTIPASVLRKIMEQEPQQKHDDARARRKNLLGTVLG